MNTPPKNRQEKKKQGEAKHSSQFQQLISEIRNLFMGSAKTRRFLNKSEGKIGQIRVLLNQLYSYVLKRAQPLLAQLQKLIDYYQMRSRREQIMILVALGVVFSWLLWSVIISPYFEFRQSLRAAYREARLEYSWLEDQTPRLALLLKKRGAQKNLLGDPAELVKSRLADAKVSAGKDGIYLITWTGSEGKDFFAVVNALLNYGASLKSIEFERADSKKSDAEFTATIKY